MASNAASEFRKQHYLARRYHRVRYLNSIAQACLSLYRIFVLFSQRYTPL